MLLSSGRWYSPGWGPEMIGFLLLIRTILYGQRCGGKSEIQIDYKLVIVWRSCLFFYGKIGAWAWWMKDFCVPLWYDDTC